MPRHATKIFNRVPLSIGLQTFEQIKQVQTLFEAWKFDTMRKNTNRSEVCELALKLGLPILKELLEKRDTATIRDLVTSEKCDNFLAKLKVNEQAKIEEKAKPQTKTLAELTDDDLAKLDTETTA